MCANKNVFNHCHTNLNSFMLCFLMHINPIDNLKYPYLYTHCI